MAIYLYSDSTTTATASITAGTANKDQNMLN